MSISKALLRRNGEELTVWLPFAKDKRPGDVIMIEGTKPPVWRIEAVIPEPSDEFDATLICSPADRAGG